jgi:hypothetical protein
VNRIIMRLEKETSHHIKISIINDHAIPRDQSLSMFLVPAGNSVPWQMWVFVMDDMEIVEEEKQARPAKSASGHGNTSSLTSRCK